MPENNALFDHLYALYSQGKYEELFQEMKPGLDWLDGFDFPPELRIAMRASLKDLKRSLLSDCGPFACDEPRVLDAEENAKGFVESEMAWEGSDYGRVHLDTASGGREGTPDQDR